MGCLDHGTALTFEYGAERLRRGAMANKHVVTQSFQEVGIGRNPLR
jgi:hypothetical protein